MTAKNALYLGLALAPAALFGWSGGAASAGQIGSYSTVTQQRLENPEPGNWLLYRRTYDGHGYSPLHQITADNVRDLAPVWTFSTGVIEPGTAISTRGRVPNRLRCTLRRKYRSIDSHN